MSDAGYGKRRRRRGGGSDGKGSGSGNMGSNSSPNAAPVPSPGQQHSTGVSPPSVMPQQAPTGGRDASKVFPMAPYVRVSELTIQQQLREQLTAPLVHKGTTTVASAKFSHFINIANLEAEPLPCALDGNYKAQVYHTTNRYNGKQVILRRLVDPNISHEVCAQAFDQWRHFRHPNLVPLHSIVTTTDFVLGHNDVLLEYRYVRGAKTLLEAFLPKEGGHDNSSAPEHVHEISEGVLWSFACQIAGLIRSCHEVGVPVRGLHLSKLLYLPVGQRVLFAGAALKDVLADGPVPKAEIEKAMRTDIINLGLILLKLATKNPNAYQLEPLQKMTTISPVLLHFITTCVEGALKIEELCRGLGERMAMELGQQLGHADFLMNECAKELHNGRLMKLLMKLNFAFAATSDMSTEPEQIAIRLLFQHIFHQVDENGRPRYDWAHVYFALNKLDTRSQDVVQLMSENDGTLLVISFADLRTLLDRVASALQPKPDVSPVQQQGVAALGMPGQQ